MRASHCWTAVGLALALSACATAGPDYHPPKDGTANKETAKGAFVGAKNDAFSQEPLPERWWSLYQDPQLDALVEEALASNADLHVAEQILERSEAIVQGAMAAKQPTVTAMGGLDGMRRSAHAVPLPGVIMDNVGLAFGYPLDIHGKLRRAIEATEGEHHAEEAARDAIRVRVAAATTAAYADVCAANYQLAVTRRVVELQQQTLNATRRLQRGGRGTAFDVSRAEAAVDASAAALPVFEASRQNALYMLATLMGRPPAEYPREVANCATLPRIAGTVPIEDGAALIRRRPDIRQAERMIASDTAKIGVAMADLYPSINLTGSAGFAGPLENFGKTNSFQFSLGPFLSWTFPNRPVVKAKIAQAEAQVRVDIAQFDAVVLKALNEAETAMETYARNRDRAFALGRARNSAALSVDQANRLFRFGRADFLNLLSSQGSLASAEVNYAAAQTALVRDQIGVFLSLGGGWQREGEGHGSEHGSGHGSAEAETSKHGASEHVSEGHGEAAPETAHKKKGH